MTRYSRITFAYIVGCLGNAQVLLWWRIILVVCSLLTNKQSSSIDVFRVSLRWPIITLRSKDDLPWPPTIHPYCWLWVTHNCWWNSEVWVPWDGFYICWPCACRKNALGISLALVQYLTTPGNLRGSSEAFMDSWKAFSKYWWCCGILLRSKAREAS